MEEIAIGTLIKLKVLETIPFPGSISPRELSKIIGAQESLIGKMIRPQFKVLGM